MSSEAQNTITVGAEPKMGLIKGTVGDDFVIPCIDFIITATTASGQSQQVAAADCQRMVWQDGRWVIGEGEEPVLDDVTLHDRTECVPRRTPDTQVATFEEGDLAI